jgi:transposase
LEGLLDDPHTRRKQRITIEQKEELRLVLSQKPVKKGYAQAEWDGPLLVKYMKDVFNLEYSIRQTQRLMKSLGFNVR